MQDLATRERVVVEVIQAKAKYPFIRVETRFQPNGGAAPSRSSAMVADQVLIKTASETSDAQLQEVLQKIEGKVLQKSDLGDGSLMIVGLPNHLPNTVPDALEALRSLPQTIQYVEPHFVSHAHLTPNDPQFVNQWALDAIRIEKAWDLETGNSTVVVGVLDTGIDYNHTDLQGRLWQNPGEIAGNGIDDDGNGITDDWRGVNFAYGNVNPNDDHGHGTHIAGIIGAVPNNARGVAGICWDVRIMNVKVMDSEGLLYTFDEVLGMDYARNKGAQIVNLSLGGYDYVQSEYDAISRLQNRGILVTASAGNEGLDNDGVFNYPASYNQGNIVSVGWSDSTDQPDFYSNYGRTTVDLFAPGRTILSTAPGSTYDSESGSSFSAPAVAAVAALLKAQNPSWNYSQLRAAMLNHVDYRPSMAGRCVSNGRLNAYESLIPKTGLPEALESGSLSWQTGGDRKWYGQFLQSQDGVDAGSSGKIYHNQTSWLETTVAGPGRLTFWWRVSCEASPDNFRFDYLQFTVNGQERAWIQGDTTWEQRTFDVPIGTQTLRWRYVKDATQSAGDDKGFVDRVQYQGDTGAPTLQITSPSGTDLLTGDLNIQGTATDDFGVQSVEYRLENANGKTAWALVTQNPDWTNWSLDFSNLPPGTNFIRLRATDYFGRVTTLNRTYTRLVALQVDIDGCGTITSNYAGLTYQPPGKTITIKAKPCPGNLFVNWTRSSGGPLTSPSFTFTVQESLQFIAHFATNQFIATQGKYNGLFYETNGVVPRSSGFFKLTLTDTGTFSGSIIADGQTNAFNGAFDVVTGADGLSVPRPGKTALNLALQLDPSSDQITGTISSGPWQSVLLADRAPFNATTNPAPFQGRYTFALPGSMDSDVSPGGSTYGAANIAAGGKVTLDGRTADDKPIAQIANLSADGDWPFYASLYNGKGVILGWFKFLSPPDLANQLVSWVRPTIAGSKWYPNGFTNDVTAAGSTYVYTSGSSILSWANGELILSGGDFAAPLTNSITLTSGNAIINNGPHNAQISLNALNGTLSGTFRASGGTKTYSLYGAVLQNLDIAVGYYAGTNSVGEVRLQTAP